MQIVLDTCALIAFVDGEPMQPAATRAIQVAQSRATAWVLNAPVVTVDRRILGYARLGHVAAIAY